VRRGRHDEDEQIKDSPYADFLSEVERAEAEARVQATFLFAEGDADGQWPRRSGKRATHSPPRVHESRPGFDRTRLAAVEVNAE
jgi:hypothetical protein